MFTPDKQPDPRLAAVVDLIDKAMQAKNKEQPRRQYLGASRVGEECQRRLAYEYHGTPKDDGADFKGKTLRIFDMGHDGEERMAQYIKQAGFDLQTHKEDGKQFGMADAEGKFKGHLDGIIHAGPLTGLKYPLLWENKALGDKSWNDVVKKGIKESKPVYYAQVQIYMAYFELESCLFTCLNRDTGDINIEIIHINVRDAQALIDKAVRIVTSANPEEMGKLSKDPTDFRCKWCDYNKRCHSTPAAPKQPTASPSWLK